MRHSLFVLQLDSILLAMVGLPSCVKLCHFLANKYIKVDFYCCL